ncbi:MAG: class IV adenylate cyclase [Phycisphaerales bacterium]|nr:class IV adenylate cyclase [Phycisphaerales bacterium]
MSPNMENVEFKAELRDLEAARAQCRALPARFMFVRPQLDTYYKLPDGRLKRREAPGVPVEWIYYHRADAVRPRLSTFAVLTDEQARTRWGTQSLREWVQVRKTRELWLLENVRIHLDVVENLGRFIEFEAQVTGKFDRQICSESVVALREAFAPVLGEPIAVSYGDLMAEVREDRPDDA